MKKIILTVIIALTAILLLTNFHVDSLLGKDNRLRKVIEGSHSDEGRPYVMENACVRFIRMKYDGPGWDNGMAPSDRADLNFLDYFHKLTDFKTASQPEAHNIAVLAKYPKGYAPPLIYMTGDGKIDVPDRDVKIMREYLMGGGMLFADCGGPAWHGAFQGFIKRVFPGESLTKIRDDDTIFQVPFPCEKGAPPVHRHGGSDALGIKCKGRWVVFYHPGHLTDAWKTNRGNLPRGDTKGTFELGVNLIYYAYSEYLELTRKYRRDGGGVTDGRRAPACSPWARYALKSVGVYSQTPPGDRPLQLIRKLVRQDSDLRAVMNILEAVPVETFSVSSPQTEDGSTKAIVVNIPDGRTLVLIFEYSAALKTYPLRDSFLLAHGLSQVSMLFDVIPKSRPPEPADFSRILFWYESSFEPQDGAVLRTMEIPRNLDDIPLDSAADLGGAWGENLSRGAESRLNSISPLVFTNR